LLDDMAVAEKIESLLNSGAKDSASFLRNGRWRPLSNYIRMDSTEHAIGLTRSRGSTSTRLDLLRSDGG
jgi:hypothetical protein